MLKNDYIDQLAFEIKKEIADQYFGFRKLIEEDSLDLTEKIRQHSIILEKRISFDLVRIYILLKNEETILAFLELIGLDEQLFYDPYLADSINIRKRVFEGQRLRGFTQSGRFKNLVFDCYERLTEHVQMYRLKFLELQELQDTISGEIDLFYRKHDLGTIMGFLHTLDEPAMNSGMEGGIESGVAEGLDQKMKIKAPRPVEQYLPILPPFPELATIKKPLKNLTTIAYRLHGKQFLATCGLDEKRHKSARNRA